MRSVTWRASQPAGSRGLREAHGVVAGLIPIGLVVLSSSDPISPSGAGLGAVREREMVHGGTSDTGVPVGPRAMLGAVPLASG